MKNIYVLNARGLFRKCQIIFILNSKPLLYYGGGDNLYDVTYLQIQRVYTVCLVFKLKEIGKQLINAQNPKSKVENVL